jgi:hypothetical protein
LEWDKSKEGNCEQPKEVVMLRVITIYNIDDSEQGDSKCNYKQPKEVVMLRAIAIYNIGDSRQGDSEWQRCESHREDGTGITCDGMYANSYVLRVAHTSLPQATVTTIDTSIKWTPILTRRYARPTPMISKN